jgi:dihydrofolate reductase
MLDASSKANLDDIYLCDSFSNAIDLVLKGDLHEKIENIYVIGGSSIYNEAFSYKFFDKL